MTKEDTLTDYTRFAKRFASPLPGQIISHMVLPLVITIFGIVATSAAVEIFPEEKRLLWAPFDLLLTFQKNGGGGARAATFFGGLVLIIPQLAINVAWYVSTTIRQLALLSDCGIVGSAGMPTRPG